MDKYKDVWDILSEAMEAGWEDPGFTELLEITKERALNYLRKVTAGPLLGRIIISLDREQ